MQIDEQQAFALFSESRDVVPDVDAPKYDIHLDKGIS